MDKNVSFSIKENTETGSMCVSIEVNLNAEEVEEFAKHCKDLDREILDIGYNTDKSKAWFFDKLGIKNIGASFCALCNKKPCSDFYARMDRIFDFANLKGLHAEQTSDHRIFLETGRGMPMWLTESKKSPYVNLLLQDGLLNDATPLEQCRQSSITRAEADPAARQLIWTYVEYARDAAKKEET